MIVVRTPLRISLAGGGTDFPEFYRHEPGAVVSTTIDKYIYVVLKRRFDQKIRVSYSKTEMVDHVDELEHEIVRECLRYAGIEHGVEIATMADIPSTGSGLGSSSALTVGLVHALATLKGVPTSPKLLANVACEIEIDRLGKPIGKQDQFIAAHGGLCGIEFRSFHSISEKIEVHPFQISAETRQRLEACLLLYYTGIRRRAEDILDEQLVNIPSRMPELKQIRGHVEEVWYALQTNDPDHVGHVLRRGWEIKKQLAGAVTTPDIDQLIEKVLDAGALGAKINGAGGGGFLMVYCPPDDHWRIHDTLQELRELPFRFEPSGSQVLIHQSDTL